MEGMGEETLSFPLLKSGKRQKVHLGRSVSTHFVADCGFDSWSCFSTHFAAFEEHMADKRITKPSRSLLQLAILGVLILEENHLRFSNSKHFRFYWTKKHFISKWYFTKNYVIGSLVVRKGKTSRDSRQNQLRLEVEELLLMFIAWTNKKASKVHKLLSQSWP